MDEKLTDPTTLYWNHFDKQPQNYPGIQQQMHPLPAGDAQNFQGHDLLAGRKALITGGDSGIGRSVAIAFAKEGADVAIHICLQSKQTQKQSNKLFINWAIKSYYSPRILENPRPPQQWCKRRSNN